MCRSSFIAALLAGLLCASFCTPSSAAPEAPDVSNIGFVVYTKSLAPGTLNARWMLSTAYSTRW